MPSRSGFDRNSPAGSGLCWRYAHVLPAMQEQAAMAVDGLLSHCSKIAVNGAPAGAGPEGVDLQKFL